MQYLGVVLRLLYLRHKLNNIRKSIFNNWLIFLFKSLQNHFLINNNSKLLICIYESCNVFVKLKILHNA